MYAALRGQVLGEDGGDERRRRAFALGASNMDWVQTIEVGWLECSVRREKSTTHLDYRTPRILYGAPK